MSSGARPEKFQTPDTNLAEEDVRPLSPEQLVEYLLEAGHFAYIASLPKHPLQAQRRDMLINETIRRLKIAEVAEQAETKE